MLDPDVIEAVQYLSDDDKRQLRNELERIASLPAGDTNAENSCTHPFRGRDAEFHALEEAILDRVLIAEERPDETLADSLIFTRNWKPGVLQSGPNRGVSVYELRS
jgi:hypothetical protein